MRGLQIAGVLLAISPSAISAAAEGRPIEEITVTAQRIEESAQKVPIALNAFTEASIEDRRIIGLADLSIFVPNLSYTQNNVGDANVSIRGVGSLVSVNDGESGVSLHRRAGPSWTMHSYGQFPLLGVAF